MKPFLLEKASSVLVIIDLQDRLLAPMKNAEEILFINKRLLKATQEMNIPTLVTEQYPRGLGPSSPSLELEKYPHILRVEKTDFCCCHEPKFMKHLNELGRTQIVLSGIEAHICLLSTALELLAKGFSVVIAADGVSSRNPLHRQWALDALSSAGASVFPEESIVYQWLQKAGTPEFKAILPLYASVKPV